MKTIYLTLISLSFATLAHADINCRTLTINQWPENPLVVISATATQGMYKVSVERPYYGATNQEGFMSSATPGRQMTFSNQQKSTVVIDKDKINGEGLFKGQITTQRDGSQDLKCTGNL